MPFGHVKITPFRAELSDSGQRGYVWDTSGVYHFEVFIIFFFLTLKINLLNPQPSPTLHPEYMCDVKCGGTAAALTAKQHVPTILRQTSRVSAVGCARNGPMQLIVLARSHKSMEEESRSEAAKAERLLAEAAARTKEAKDQVLCPQLGSPQTVTHNHLPKIYIFFLKGTPQL